MKRRWWIGLAFAVVGVLAGLAIAFDPAARVQGWVNGEPFFQGRAATAWRRDLRQPDDLAASTSTDALAAGKSDALPVCAWLVRHAPESQVRTRAVEALTKMGQAAAPAGGDLVAALADPDPLVRAGSARAIGALAPGVPGAVPALVSLFPDRDAIRAVAEFREAGAEAVPPLIKLTKHGDAAVRRQSVRTLGRIGRPALAALPELMTLTASDPDTGVREQSAEAFGDIGPAAAAGIPTLVLALHDENARVRRDAVRSLGKMGPEARDALGAVQALANDPDEDVKKAAKDAARKISGK